MIETFVLGRLAGGGVEYMHYDHATDAFTIERKYDKEPVLEFNHEQQKVAPSNWRGDMHKVASIPLTLYFDLREKGIIQDPERMKRWLNDPDNRMFRTKLGRV